MNSVALEMCLALEIRVNDESLKGEETCVCA